VSRVFLEDSITLPVPVLKLEGRGVRYAPLMQPYDTKPPGKIFPSPLYPELYGHSPSFPRSVLCSIRL
jgi:hypothetical protein